MKSFTDNAGQEWRLNYSLGAKRIIKRDFGVDLVDLFGDNNKEAVAIIFDDYERLASILWVLCQSQAEQSGVSPDEFAERLGGDVFADAADALVEAVIDFFPNPNRRKALRGWVASVRKVQHRMLTEVAPLKLEELDDQVSSLTTDQLVKLLNG